MRILVSILFLAIVVVVSSKPIEEDDLAEQNVVVPESRKDIEMVASNSDSEKPGSKDELEGAESAYFGFPYYYPYVYKYPVILYGK